MKRLLLIDGSAIPLPRAIHSFASRRRAGPLICRPRHGPSAIPAFRAVGRRRADARRLAACTEGGVKVAVDPSRVVVELLSAPSGVQTCQAIARFCAERPHACSAVPPFRLSIERAIKATAATCVIISKGT